METKEDTGDMDQKWSCSCPYKWDARRIKGDHGKGNKRFGTVQVTLIASCMRYLFNTVDQTTFQDKKITIGWMLK